MAIRQITGLWTKESKSGNTYPSASLEYGKLIERIKEAAQGVKATDKVTIALFSNTKKETEKHPDWNLSLIVNDGDYKPAPKKDESEAPWD